MRAPEAAELLEPREPAQRRWDWPLIGFSLACGVLLAAGGVGYRIVVWIVAAMIAYGLARLAWRLLRWTFTA
jgi:hypothetical protein